MVDRLTTVRAALDACDRFTRTGVVDHAMLTVYQAAPAIADLCREVEAGRERIATLEAELARAIAAVRPDLAQFLKATDKE